MDGCYAHQVIGAEDAPDPEAFLKLKNIAKTVCHLPRGCHASTIRLSGCTHGDRVSRLAFVSSQVRNMKDDGAPQVVEKPATTTAGAFGLLSCTCTRAHTVSLDAVGLLGAR